MITQVIIRCTRGGHKFVVLRNEKNETVVFADDSPKLGYHRELRRQYVAENNLNACCLGGGWIRYDAEKKVIQIGGSSGDFGREPDREETVNAIKRAHPDFDVGEFNS